MSNSFYLKSLLVILFATLFAANTKAQQLGEVKFDNDGHLFVVAEVGDTVGRFIFDTGAGITLIDSTFLAESGLKSNELHPITLNGLGSEKTKAQYTKDTILFGLGQTSGLSTATVIADIKELVPISDINGVLGIETLKNTIYSINYKESTIKILSADTLAQLSDFEKISYKGSKSNFIIIPVEIDFGKKRGKTLKTNVHYDTGNPSGVFMTWGGKRGQQMNRFVDKSVIYSVGSLGVGGGGEVVKARANKIRVGQTYIPIEVVSLSFSSAIKNSGIIGNDIMAGYDIIIDGPNSVIYLRDNGRRKLTDTKLYGGFGISKLREHYAVNALSHHEVGLNLGDVVTHINGKPIEGYSKEQRREFSEMVNLKYSLTIKRGETIFTVDIINFNDDTLWL